MHGYEIRAADERDATELAQLSSESFGYPLPDTPPRSPNAAGWRTYVATHDDRVVAAVMDRRYDSWFWGSRFSTCGVASVKVALEHRGNALLTPLFERMLADAVQEGVTISTLYPTAPGIYRRFGYELISSYDELSVPTAALAAVRTTGGAVRRGSVADVPTIRDLYDRWASSHNGPLTRDGASFPATDEDLAKAFPGMTIAVDDEGTPTGYALWTRIDGYHDSGVVEVQDLIALSDQGLRQLLHALGTSATVAPTTIISMSTPDLAQIVLPSHPWSIKQANPYGIAILDVAGTFTSRSYPTWLDLDLRFAVDGLPVAGQDGAYQLRVRDGRADVERAERAEIAYTARGLALRFAGSHSCTDLRRAGFMTGPTDDDDRWDAVFSGPSVHIRDYF
ncbi:GNAT family N-acetyltransferase [Luteipulveratus mongoliensis]|uniref:N-acetyltransferase domain-containing protein n=1 Tax=Luteipulveratus mongoliensis TaxID=571913 RepID=A0A0K1JII9_9MICO|nr:GNAT family N-acetyltransferase [Luteipulveratus mongoliensis]AKU16537.1 hypothetical protein VV02_12820 [Luteipulveratus mongoliensis]